MKQNNIVKSTILFLLTISIFSLPSNAQFVPDSNTLALWHMDEDSVSPIATDSSGNSRTLTVIGTDWTVAGKFGKGLHFNQSVSAVAYLQNNPVNFPANMPFTIDGFVKVNSNGKERNIFIYFKPDESFSRIIAILVQSDGTVRCDLRVNAQAGSPPLQQAFGKNIADEEWHRITCVRTVGTDPRLLLYVDNVLEYNAAGNNGALGFAANMQLSFSRNTPNEGIDGEIDEWRILSQTLYPQASDYSRATIKGIKFEDIDGDGIWDIGEPRVEGWTIFLDIDNNGVLDTGEVSVITDINGNYEFTHLLPGTYHVREVQESEWTQTTPDPGPIILDGSIEQITGINFGNHNNDKNQCNCTNLTQKVEELKQRVSELENKMNDSENKLTGMENELEATNNKLSALENKINNTTNSLENLKNKADAIFGYLKNLLLPLKKEMICGYIKDNKLIKYEALGLKCSISRNNCICSVA